MKIEMKFLALLSTDSKKHQTLMWTGRRTDLLLLLLLFLRRAGAVVLPTLCQYSNSALQKAINQAAHLISPTLIRSSDLENFLAATSQQLGGILGDNSR